MEKAISLRVTVHDRQSVTDYLSDKMLIDYFVVKTPHTTDSLWPTICESKHKIGTMEDFVYFQQLRYIAILLKNRKNKNRKYWVHPINSQQLLKR